MIKISCRKNLIYLLLLFISFFLRRILSIIIDKIYGINNSLIFIFLMVLGEIIGGSIIFLYQNTFLKKSQKKEKNLHYQFVYSENQLNRADKLPKIILLIFFAAYFDLIEFFILSNFLPKIAIISATSTLRLCCIITIASSIICTYALKYKIGRHHKFSLIILSITSLIIITIEFINKPKEIELGNFIFAYILILCHFLFLSFTDVIEKYLADYDYLNPLKILMTEGIIEFTMSLIYSIFHDPFKEVKKIYEEVDTNKFILFVFLLILFSVFSAGINIYKILCNVLYSPMAKSLTSYFLNSVFIIYYYIDGTDFKIDGERNFFYFIINLIFSVIIELFGLVYNELFILSCCDLSEDTHHGITERSLSTQIELDTNIVEDDEDNI